MSRFLQRKIGTFHPGQGIFARDAGVLAETDGGGDVNGGAIHGNRFLNCLLQTARQLNTVFQIQIVHGGETGRIPV